MKIAVFLGDFPALSETFVINQINFLISNGHEITIYANSPRKNETVHKDFYKYDLSEKINYAYMPDNKLKRLLGVFKIISKAVSKPRIISTLNFLKYKKFVFNLRPLYYSSIVEEVKYDILLCHFGPNGNVAAILKDIGLIDGKLATIFHGSDVTEYVQKSGENVYQLLFNKGELFLPVNNKFKDKLIDLGCNKNKVVTQHMGVNIKDFIFKEYSYSKESRFKILSIGRLVEKKGFIYAIEAVKLLVQRNTNIKYTIIGDGPLRSQLELKIKEYNLGDFIELVGWKEHTEVKNYLDKSHLLIVPSITSSLGDQEGIPMVIMEGAGSGLPIISSEHSGIPEIINYNTGFLTKEKDYEDIYNKLLYIIHNYSKLGGLLKNSRLLLESDFNLDTQNLKLEKMLSELKIK